jgi:hypothetical protein
LVVVFSAAPAGAAALPSVDAATFAPAAEAAFDAVSVLPAVPAAAAGAASDPTAVVGAAGCWATDEELPLLPHAARTIIVAAKTGTAFAARDLIIKVGLSLDQRSKSNVGTCRVPLPDTWQRLDRPGTPVVWV